MQIRFLLGPAGSGKTFRCLSEIRDALHASPDGLPLILLAPKQATFQLERRLLADPDVPGYTRLHILSFERLARFVFEQLHRPPPRLLSEEGRVMVLRSLLARGRDDLRLFRASARLTGFAQQLSRILHELQRNQQTPETLSRLAAEERDKDGLALKLHDLALLLRRYLDWLDEHRLQDAAGLLDAATAALRADRTQNMDGGYGEDGSPDLEQSPNSRRTASGPENVGGPVSSGSPLFCGLWLDGFAAFSTQEVSLLEAVVARCDQVTLAFCLDRIPRVASPQRSWLSHWSVVQQAFAECRKRLAALPGARLSEEVLARDAAGSRFRGSPVLKHLEQHWARPKPLAEPGPTAPGSGAANASADPENSVRLVTCANPETEATLAAREILRFVRAGGRFREVGLVLRTLEGYHQILQRVLSRFEIPFFLDRREPVSHHPLAELTRSALRTVAFRWAHDDWFAALKTGLVSANETEIDQLENEALARGWEGLVWQQPLPIADDPELLRQLERVRLRILPPFQSLALLLGSFRNQPTGLQLAEALREFWHKLEVERQLRRWSQERTRISGFRLAAQVHTTVWEQMNSWLDNVEVAFPRTALSVREWLPVLESGLANLTVGVIPPALDQVLVGVIDRSRNPDLRLVLVLGLNDTVFPSPPEPPALLTEVDRVQLERRGLDLDTNPRRHLARERYYAYIACTRARQRLVLTTAAFDSDERPLNPSPFLSHVKQLLPSLRWEIQSGEFDWSKSEHAGELLVPLMRLQEGGSVPAEANRLWELAGLSTALSNLRCCRNPPVEESLSAELAQALYGATLRTSVSRLEQFAACPFKFFVHSGLRAEERLRFELDAREQGSFQHDVLRLFHEQLRQEGKHWRDIAPPEARDRIAGIARALTATYHDGLIQARGKTRFQASLLARSLQDFVEIVVGWMRGQYSFDPVAVELPFGDETGSPAWELDLGDGWRLALHGRIDRVDICRDDVTDRALCVVVDYKSGARKLDPLLVEHGVQLQLLAYLNVVRRWPDPAGIFGSQRLTPAGAFYVNLHGRFERASSRRDAMAEVERARKLAYRHSGRFDASALRRLDSRTDARQGDQFNYRLNKDGSVHKGSREALPRPQFKALLDSTEINLKRMGREIFAGIAHVAPFRKGTMTACDMCGYQAICRFDSGTHPYRVLKRSGEERELS